MVVRYNPHSLNLYDAESQKIDVEAVLRKTTVPELCLPVQVRSPKKEFIHGHLHARRLPPAQAAQARQRARAEARKKGRTVQQRTLALAEWVLIFTTLAPEVLPTETVMALYRVRWQVEIYQPYNLRKTQVIMIQWWQAIARCGRRLALPVIVPT